MRRLTGNDLKFAREPVLQLGRISQCPPHSLDSLVIAPLETQDRAVTLVKREPAEVHRGGDETAARSRIQGEARCVALITDGVPPWESYTSPPGSVSMYPDSAATVAAGAAARVVAATAVPAAAGPVIAMPAASRLSPATDAAVILSRISVPLTRAGGKPPASIQGAFHPVPSGAISPGRARLRESCCQPASATCQARISHSSSPLTSPGSSRRRAGTWSGLQGKDAIPMGSVDGTSSSRCAGPAWMA